MSVTTSDRVQMLYPIVGEGIWIWVEIGRGAAVRTVEPGRVGSVKQSSGAGMVAMLGRTYESQRCSVARTLELVGERWTLLIIRDAFLGVRRFGDFADRLGVARNVLQDRLERLVTAGILERVPYPGAPAAHEYRLTEMGRDLWPSIVALLQFGDKHLAGEDGTPMLLLHRDCGGEMDERRGSAAPAAKPIQAARLSTPMPGPGGAKCLRRRER